MTQILLRELQMKTLWILERGKGADCMLRKRIARLAEVPKCERSLRSNNERTPAQSLLKQIQVHFEKV